METLQSRPISKYTWLMLHKRKKYDESLVLDCIWVSYTQDLLTAAQILFLWCSFLTSLSFLSTKHQQESLKTATTGAFNAIPSKLPQSQDIPAEQSQKLFSKCQLGPSCVFYVKWGCTPTPPYSQSLVLVSEALSLFYTTFHFIAEQSVGADWQSCDRA